MNRFRNFFLEEWEHRPLRLILVLSLVVRLVAAVWSRGYGWHDDHFLIIESSQSWVDGYDYNNWLPSSQGENPVPSGHSFTYPGLHYLYFKLCQWVGLDDPGIKMFGVRLLNALFSMLVVYFGYRLVALKYSKKEARMSGLLLAITFFMPFVSVRDLVEVFCIPFLFWAVWLLAAEGKSPVRNFFLAGIMLGLAFSVRYQTLFFTLGFGIVFLWRGGMLKSLVMGLGFCSSVLLTQGLVDYLIWGYPFAEFLEYFRYNQTAGATDYFVREWYMYLLFIAGILIPPFSLLLILGFFRDFRKYLPVFCGVLVFIIFHSWFPNKQERFVLPVIPFLITFGYPGLIRFIESRRVGSAWLRFYRFSRTFFWVINLLALPVISTAYSKRSRVEAMVALSEKPDLTFYVIENSNSGDYIMLPQYYLGKWPAVDRITADRSPARLHNDYCVYSESDRPNYLIMMTEENFEARKKALEEFFFMKDEIVIEPGLVDRLVHWLNPVNKNQTCRIYRIAWKGDKCP
jgi:4-amino-4-deoxy-L-arabinose transferase-like glycosyltransferase